MPRVYHNLQTFNVADGATGSVTVSIPQGILDGITAGPTAGEGPVKIAFDLNLNVDTDFTVTVGSGWARGFSTLPGSGGVTVQPKTVFAKDGELAVFARNDSGAAAVIAVQIWGERV